MKKERREGEEEERETSLYRSGNPRLEGVPEEGKAREHFDGHPMGLAAAQQLLRK